MTKNIKRYGATWIKDGDLWLATIHDRYTCMTWKFGNIWQCRIDIPCDPAPNSDVLRTSLGIRIGLEPTESYYKSMKKAVEWVETYIKNGPKSWKELSNDCYEHWPTIYRTELDIIEHVFFCGGNGYGWLDGHIIAEHPEDHFVDQERHESPDSISRIVLDLAEKLGSHSTSKELQKLIDEYKEEERIRKDKEYRKSQIPQPDPETYKFSEHFWEGSANIFCIPDNVADDYLLICKKAWDFFRYKNSNEKISEETRIKHWEAFHQRFNDRLSRLL